MVMLVVILGASVAKGLAVSALGAVALVGSAWKARRTEMDRVADAQHAYYERYGGRRYDRETLMALNHVRAVGGLAVGFVLLIVGLAIAFL